MIKTLGKLISYGCIHCGRAIQTKNNILCSYCEHHMKQVKPICSSKIISAVSYSAPPAKTLIRYMKDNFDPYVSNYSAKLITEKLYEFGLSEKLSDFYITYAPRNPIKLISKRFDQSKEIADFLAINLFDDENRVLSMFKRFPFGDEQKSLDSHNRKENAREIFSLKDDVKIPEKIILVDDLTTTGSTLFTLRDILYKAGVKECVLCTVAVNDYNPDFL